MTIQELIDQESVLFLGDFAGKDKLLDALADAAATRFDLDKGAIFDVLWEREGLGSTALGGGVAVPHGRVPGVAAPMALLARLATPVEFGAQDGQPVDIVFVLLAAVGAGADHLEALKQIAAVAKDGAQVARIRACKTGKEAYNCLGRAGAV
ncbi:PTS IIA-like nitrogen-regulatory protein PtsN [Alphaproteobacteria bacterium]|nr:PTS IIA-like nitrogen-regulatory protein PtsN [Alphaproteobacteria bacterium]